jgi:predicted enzyme involved in methoxymalonyl-ACP biosynthesis
VKPFAADSRRVEEAQLQYLVQQARLRGITGIIGRYIPTAKNGLVRDHFSRLGFVQTGSRNDETIWQLGVSGYGERNLPLKVDAPREWKLASAGGS